MTLTKTDYERINDALQADPSLAECFLEMIDTVQETRGKHSSGDDAEDAVVDVIRKTGQMLLKKWMERKKQEAEVAAESDSTLRPHEKKRSSGARLSEI